MSYAPAGKRAEVRSLGKTPLETVNELLDVVDDPPPDPASLGPGDVVVAVNSANVGWVDLLMMSGQYQHVPEPPYTPGLRIRG